MIPFTLLNETMSLISIDQFDEWAEAYPELAQCYGDVYQPADELDDIEDHLIEYVYGDTSSD